MNNISSIILITILSSLAACASPKIFEHDEEKPTVSIVTHLKMTVNDARVYVSSSKSVLSIDRIDSDRERVVTIAESAHESSISCLTKSDDSGKVHIKSIAIGSRLVVIHSLGYAIVHIGSGGIPPIIEITPWTHLRIVLQPANDTYNSERPLYFSEELPQNAEDAEVLLRGKGIFQRDGMTEILVGDGVVRLDQQSDVRLNQQTSLQIEQWVQSFRVSIDADVIALPERKSIRVSGTLHPLMDGNAIVTASLRSVSGNNVSRKPATETFSDEPYTSLGENHFDTLVRKDGSFVFPSVPPGNYKLRMIQSNYTDQLHVKRFVEECITIPVSSDTLNLGDIKSK